MSFDRSRPGEHHYKAKLALRWITLVVTTISIILAGHGDTYSWILYIPLGSSFIWNTANIARRMTAATPIHPGANVSVDLLTGLIWVYLYALNELSFTAEVLQLGHYPYLSNGTATCVENSPQSGCNWSTSSQISIDRDSISETRTAAIVTLSACALSTIDAVLHIALFVFACVDTYRFRHAHRYPEYRREPRKSSEDQSQAESNVELPDYEQHTHELYSSRRSSARDQSQGESKVELPDPKQHAHELFADREVVAEKRLVAEKP